MSASRATDDRGGSVPAGGSPGRRSPRREAQRPEPIEARLASALERVRALALEACLRRADGRRPPLERLSFELHLDLKQESCTEEAHRVLGVWGETIHQAQAAAGAFALGHVFCFWCNAPRCVHSAPPSPSQVFDGYAPTGRPRWAEFSDLCLEMQDLRLERILTRGEGIVTLYQPGDRLKTAQIDEFGRNSPIYDIVAQIVAGYLPTEQPDEDLAASFQVVATRLGPTEARMGVNVVSSGRLFDRSGGFADSDLGRMVRALSKQLERIESRMNGSLRRGLEHDPSTLVERALKDLARDLDHHYRVATKRTWHARERADEGSRPTESAFPEARKAPDDRILEDVVEGTLVVLGRSGRVHVFAKDGRHVTSVRMRGGEIRRRVATSRWRPAAAGLLPAFRASLRTGTEDLPHSG